MATRRQQQEALGFLKVVGETHESTFRTGYLGNGFYGFAGAARDFGGTRYRRGGDVAPLPAGTAGRGLPCGIDFAQHHVR